MSCCLCAANKAVIRRTGTGFGEHCVPAGSLFRVACLPGPPWGKVASQSVMRPLGWGGTGRWVFKTG